MISINWQTKVIYVPQADLISLGGTDYELDIDAFRLILKDLEDGEEGMAFPQTHRHNTEVSVGGVTLARVVEIINGYTITFEDDIYTVNLVGANSNIGDVINLNGVSVRSSNSAGMIISGSGVTAQDKLDIRDAVWSKLLSELTVDGTVGKRFADSLPVGIRKNVALSNFQFFMTDAADHVTGKTGLTGFTSTVSIDGGSFNSLTNSVSEVGYGVYKINLTSEELNGDILTLRFAASGADTRVLTVLTEN